MKLLTLSDLHVECASFRPEAAVLAAADVVVLAGDIHNGAQTAAWARQTFGDKPVVLVAGNHELYDGHWERTLDEIRTVARQMDVHFLENSAVTIDGLQFLGATLWTDFAYFGLEQRSQAMEEARRFMADYRAIQGCSPELTAQRHWHSLQWLQQELDRPGAASARVVVTHHYPHRQSTAAQYRSDLCTAAFGSQLSLNLFAQAGLWVHGHTHSSHNYAVGACRVVCNPRGYPRRRIPGAFENADFDPHLLLEQAQDGRWQVWQGREAV